MSIPMNRPTARPLEGDSWTKIETRRDGDTYYMPVVGGWLYRVREWNEWNEQGSVSVSVTFVPDTRK